MNHPRVLFALVLGTGFGSAAVFATATAQERPVRWDSVLTQELKKVGSSLVNYAERPLAGTKLDDLLNDAHAHLTATLVSAGWGVDRETLYYPVVLWADCASNAWDGQKAAAAVWRGLESAGYRPLTQAATPGGNVSVWQAKDPARPRVAASLRLNNCATDVRGSVTAVLYQLASDAERKPHTLRK